MYTNINMRNFSLNSFQNICRVCMAEDALETLQDGHRKILTLISKVQYSKNDELPQKICGNCVRRVNDVMSLGLICKRIDQTLKKYLEKLKLENMEITLQDPLKIEQEQEKNIEFIDVNEVIDVETNHVKQELEKIKDEMIEAEPYSPPKPPRPFQCKNCRRRFSVRSVQKVRMREAHAHQSARSNKRHIKDKPYECLICFKTFYYLKSYLKHNIIHGSDISNKKQ